MEAYQIIGQILGIFVALGCILAPQMPKRWQILLVSALANFCSGVNLVLIGAGLTASFACFVAVIHCLFNSVKAKKGSPSYLLEKIFFSGLYFVGWSIGFFLSLHQGTASVFDLLPLIATGFFVATVFSTKERNMRLCSMCNALIYIVYDIIFPNTAVVAQIFTVASTCIALIRYREKRTKAKLEPIEKEEL